MKRTSRGGSVLVLLSGGIDSAACARYYLDQNFTVRGLFVNYGQKSLRWERAAAQRVAKRFKFALDEIRISGIHWQGQMRFELQGRNALLASVALAHFSQRSGLIAMGIHAGTPYPDCSKDFQQIFAQLAQVSTQGRVAVDFPFGTATKRQIGTYCREKDVPIDLT